MYLTPNTIGAPVVAGREIGVGADGDRGDDCGLAEETLDQGGAAARLRRVLRGEHGDGALRHGARAARAEDRGLGVKSGRRSAAAPAPASRDG